MNVLTVIPARGGSKGIPGKNIAPVAGKPLMAWTLELALAVPELQRIVVSSDDDDILAVAGAYPGIAARRRPPGLALDSTPTAPVVADVLAEEEREGHGPFDAILLLQVTAPLREVRHVQDALRLLRDGAETVISVTGMRDMHPARMYRLGPAGHLQPLLPELEVARRQDIPPVYYRNGSIYLVRRDVFERTGSLMAKPSTAYVMEDRYLLNIDEPRDMDIAQVLVRKVMGARADG
jgi:CMP-N-acetylneuraminic acid synthetase